MKTKLQLVFPAILLLSLMSALMLYAAGKLVWNDGIKVVLVNDSSSPVSNVRLQFKGGECKVDNLPGKCRRTFLAYIRGESALSLTFMDVDSVQRFTPIDVYLEPGYLGTIRINISESGKTSWLKQTVPY